MWNSTDYEIGHKYFAMVFKSILEQLISLYLFLYILTWWDHHLHSNPSYFTKPMVNISDSHLIFMILIIQQFIKPVFRIPLKTPVLYLVY